MPRYFFEIHNGLGFTQDNTGVEIDGLELVRQEAGATLGTMARDLLRDGEAHDIVIEVRNEAGQRVLVAKLAATYETTDLAGFSPTE